jgi:hypothetical protein
MQFNPKSAIQNPKLSCPIPHFQNNSLFTAMFRNIKFAFRNKASLKSISKKTQQCVVLYRFSQILKKYKLRIFSALLGQI